MFDALYVKDSYEVLILCCQSKALFAKGCIIGARKSRHSQSSLVLANKMNAEGGCLAEIIYFLECVVPKTGNNTLHNTHCVAALQKHDGHFNMKLLLPQLHVYSSCK